jgi:hypothetical protein
MKATILIEKLEDLVKKHGDRDVCVRGKSTGTFGHKVNTRMGKSPDTKDKICITGDWRG